MGGSERIISITVSHSDKRWNSKAAAVTALFTQLDNVMSALEQLRDSPSGTIDSRGDTGQILIGIQKFEFIALMFLVRGFAFGNADLQEITEALPNSDISQWRWPYIHEPKIPIPVEVTTTNSPATLRYVRNDEGLQDPTPRPRHSKRRRKRKRRKGKKDIQQFSARDPEYHSGGPVINYDPVATNEAQVHVVISHTGASESQRGKFRHPDDPDFHASATLMDFNEDPASYLRTTEKPKYSNGEIIPFNNALPMTHVEEGMPLIPKKPKRNRKKNRRRKDQSLDGSSKPGKNKKKQMVRVRIPVRALVYEDASASREGRSRYFRKRSQFSKHPVSPPPLVTLHSPTRIFVPVWEKGEFSGRPEDDKQNCIRCPANATLIAKRGESRVLQTVPPVAICPSLARRPGTLNLAVTSGPRPGTRLIAGEYPVQLIAWKFRGHVSSCKYTVFVKVRKCPNVDVPENLSMDCPNGMIWGSVCKFKCSSKQHLLRGVAIRSCEENGDGMVDWTASIPTCIPVEPVTEPKIMKPCKEPKSVVDGAVVCGAPKSGNNMYADKTICQYFCYPGFAMALQNQTHSLIVCQDGEWSPSITVKCIVDHCLHPGTNRQGVIFNCGENKGRLLNGRMTYGKGSQCHFQCEAGFVQLDARNPIESVMCLAPNWNSSAVPDCVRASPPLANPGDCRDVTLVVEPGESLIFGIDIKAPRFTSQIRSEDLTPTCTLSAKQLKRGSYTNDCKVEDPRTGLTANCTYQVKIRELIPPKPDPKDCSDKIIYASQSGTTFSKNPRFYSSDDGQTVLTSICTYHGDLSFGKYINLCTAMDPQLNITGNCSYSIEVKAYSCPVPKNIPNGKLKCYHQRKSIITDNYPPDTTCEYSCTDGYIIPNKFHKRKIRKCLGSLRWSVSVYPYCKKAIRPQFHPDDCQQQVHYVQDSKDSVSPTVPRLKSHNKNGNLKVLCSLNDNLSVGNYSNNCQVIDTESGLSSTCTYDIIIRARTCLPLETIDFADVVCSVREVDVGHPISSVCGYVCHPGYVIPTSQLSLSTKACMSNAEWNNTALPNCSEKVLPQPNNSSCQDKIIKTNDLSTLMPPLPIFKSSVGNLISLNCSPSLSLIEDFGILNVSCIAYDVELRTSNTCNFTVTVLPDEIEDEFPEKDEPPIAIEPGCTDYLLQAKAGESMTFVYPEFVTARNTSADVTCTQLNMTGHNFTELVACDAVDPETNISTSCSFHVTLYYPQTESIEETTLAPSLNCPHLTAPENGYVSCETPYVCKVTCHEGYDFPADFYVLKKKSLNCNKEDGTWDFHNEYGSRMPECLRELPTTSVEVWLQFKGEVENCVTLALTNLQAEVADRLLQMNDEVCQTLNCTEAFQFNCTHDDKRNRLALVTTWTIRTSFRPQDYEDDIVPLAETQLETILETTQKAVTTNDDFRQEMLQMGLKLWQNSYSRGHILLVCDERGFMVDPYSDKCVECPTDMAEINRKCESCPENYYQNRTGQTSCIECLQDFGGGPVPEKCLWGDDYVA